MSSYPYSTNRIAGIMNADELAELRQVFNEACHRSCLAPDAPAAKFIASGLLTAFRAGVSNRAILLRLVSNPSNYACEAGGRPQGTLTEVDLDLVAVAHEVFRISRHGSMPIRPR
jgi:hypothetical protein